MILEAELGQAKEVTSQLNEAKAELELEVAESQEELQNMHELNETLEQRLSLEKTSVSRRPAPAPLARPSLQSPFIHCC